MGVGQGQAGLPHRDGACRKRETSILHSVSHRSWGFGAESRACDEGSDA